MSTEFLVVKNNAVSTLSTTIGAGDSSLTVVDGSVFPSTFPFHVSVDNEIIRVGGRSGNDLTSLTRSQQGTSATGHNAGTGIELRVTAKSVTDLNSAFNKIEKETEIDFGATGAWSKAFTVTDADVLGTSKIWALHSAKAATGRSQDENEMDVLVIRAAPKDAQAGTVQLYVDSLTGPVSGKFWVTYHVLS